MRIAEKKKSQIAALYEQCSGLPADVRSCQKLSGEWLLYRNGTSAMEYEQSKGCAGGAGQNQGMVKAVYWRGLLLF